MQFAFSYWQKLYFDIISIESFMTFRFTQPEKIYYYSHWIITGYRHYPVVFHCLLYMNQLFFCPSPSCMHWVTNNPSLQSTSYTCDHFLSVSSFLSIKHRANVFHLVQKLLLCEDKGASLCRQCVNLLGTIHSMILITVLCSNVYMGAKVIFLQFFNNLDTGTI